MNNTNNNNNNNHNNFLRFYILILISNNVYPNETEINVVHPIYEFTILLLPARRVHPEGKCNQETLQDIDKYLMVEEKPTKKEKISEPKKNEDEVDPRWAALQKLKNNNKNKK